VRLFFVREHAVALRFSSSTDVNKTALKGVNMRKTKFVPRFVETDIRLF